MSGQTLGSLLRQKRESLGLTLEKVEGFTRIRIKHLEAIESDDLSSIPSVPQARGFIRNYAAFLGVTPEEMAAVTGGTRPRAPAPAKPAAEPAAPPPAAAASSASPAADAPPPRTRRAAPIVSRSAAYANTRPVPPRPQVKRVLRADTLLSLAVTAVVVALLGWGGYHMVMSLRSTPLPQPAAASATATLSPAPAVLTPSETGAGSPLATAAEGTPGAADTPPAVTPGTVSIATLSPTPFPTPLGGVYTDVRIQIEVLQRAYLEVEVDGKPYQENGLPGRVLPGQTFDFIGRQTVKISTGNGAGIRVIFNGVDQGAIGRFGEVVTQTYTPTGMITPVPPPTATPTVTPTLTSTAAPG